MKANLRGVENTVDNDDTRLEPIGWGGRKAKTSLEAPREYEHSNTVMAVP